MRCTKKSVRAGAATALLAGVLGVSGLLVAAPAVAELDTTGVPGV